MRDRRKTPLTFSFSRSVLLLCLARWYILSECHFKSELMIDSSRDLLFPNTSDEFESSTVDKPLLWCVWVLTTSTRSCVRCVCVCLCTQTENTKGVNKDVPMRGKRREMSCKTTLGLLLLLLSECQFIYFVIPSHTFCWRENAHREREG